MALRLLSRSAAALVAQQLGPAAQRLPTDWNPFASLAGESKSCSPFCAGTAASAPTASIMWPCLSETLRARQATKHSDVHGYDGRALPTVSSSLHVRGAAIYAIQCAPADCCC